MFDPKNTKLTENHVMTMKKIDINNPEAQSADLVAGNIAQFKILFPELITEGPDGVAVNVDVLKALVGDKSVNDADEKYGLNWHGKRRARQLALTPSIGTLRPCPEESVDWATTQNLMIEGDNLEVLKLMQKSYAGKVKLIYIDPPYNTGKDFVYPDDFQDNIENYLELTGQVEGGQKISSNTESSGRFHTDWLNMMYPRLKLARTLLKRDGVVFISIDDRELSNLRILADELFGEENFVSTITVVNNMKGRNDKKHVAACHEYVVIYAGQDFVSNGLPLTEEKRAAFKYSDDRGYKYALRDLRKRGGPDKREDRPKMYFPIYWDEKTGAVSLERQANTDVEIYPVRGDGSEGRWRWGAERVAKYLEWMHPKRSEKSGRLDIEHRVYLDASVEVNDWLEDGDDEEDEGAIERTSKPKSVWFGGEFSTDNSKRALKALLPGEVFDFPKSIDFLRTCILLSTKGSDLILDLFSGSGSTAQATMQQNAIDSQFRRFICIQLPEPLASSDKNQKAGAKLCADLGVPSNIAELTKERIRRAATKTKVDNPEWQGDTGFRVFKLDSSNIRAWNPKPENLEATLLDYEDHLLEGRSEADVLYELLLKLGLDLCVPIEQRIIAEREVYAVGGGVLMACLAEQINREQVEVLAQGIIGWYQELAPAGDTTCVFRDSAFADDVVKTNLAAILEQHGIQNVRSL
ncbi:site-specific DNA-methyltransferase [Serratia marcescens]|uniref:site-specific DNA-methyltransferase n=1 Tax=Serratia marcescens TaxID=615 RepID=UPI0027E4CE40|nr:site-specific DNA-methyltransferase [Serratia marcescens]